MASNHEALSLVADDQILVHPTMNEFVQIMDAMAFPVVQTYSMAAQPPNASHTTLELGQLFFIPGSPTGEFWTGNAGKLALWWNKWFFFTVREGWRAFFKEDGHWRTHNGVNFKTSHTKGFSTLPFGGAASATFNQTQWDNVFAKLAIIHAGIIASGLMADS